MLQVGVAIDTSTRLNSASHSNRVRCKRSWEGSMRHSWWRTGGLPASGVAFALLAPSAPARADGARRWRLTPPGERAAAAGSVVAANVSLSRSGHLKLTVQRGGTTVVEPSALGILAADTDFSAGLWF